MKIFTLLKKPAEITLFAIVLLNLNPTVVNTASLTHLIEALSKQEQEEAVKDVSENFDILTPKDRREFEKLLKEALGVSLFEKKEKASRKILKHKWKTRPGKHILLVYATSFGKPGNKGELRHFKDGSKVRWGIVAAALPDPSAIGKWVEVRRINGNGKRTRWVKMKVKDLGPWFRNDPYWEKKSKQPRAVRYFKKKKESFLDLFLSRANIVKVELITK